MKIVWLKCYRCQCNISRNIWTLPSTNYLNAFDITKFTRNSWRERYDISAKGSHLSERWKGYSREFIIRMLKQGSVINRCFRENKVNHLIGLQLHDFIEQTNNLNSILGYIRSACDIDVTIHTHTHTYVLYCFTHHSVTHKEWNEWIEKIGLKLSVFIILQQWDEIQPIKWIPKQLKW